MTCQELLRLPLDDFVDGLLDDEGRAVVATHLKECPACAAYVETLSETRDLLQQTEPILASQQFEQRLDTRLRWEDLRREGVKLLALGLAAVAALLRLLLARPGSGETSAAFAPSEKRGQTNKPLRR
jgi:anti-sigma factor RsiW